MQINQPNHGGSGTARSSTINCPPLPSPPVPACTGELFDLIEYTAKPGDDVYLCTAVSWTGSKGGGNYLYDTEPFTPGNQCEYATTIEVPGPPDNPAVGEIVGDAEEVVVLPDPIP